jgi:ribosomal protein S18 acetylase RimI-like enzyme
MEVQLRNWRPIPRVLPAGYSFVPWRQDLVELHADAKFRSFRGEIDAAVFPCLGDAGGCRRLMEDISSRMGFCREATWLIRWNDPRGDGEGEWCGTIQGVRDGFDVGGVQNLGICPDHRGRGLGTALLLRALDGFWSTGVRRVYLEVTALNEGAVRLYQRLGFRCSKTVYKAVEAPLAEVSP